VVSSPCDDRNVSVRPAVLAIAIVFASCLASCGGSDDDGDQVSLPSGHADVAVIEGWIETLSDGDVSGAADYFAVPSVAENGAAPVTLRSRADVLAFNRSLPCGAKLVRARPLGRFIAATFRLTERPGGACDGGAGQLARTAFVIRDGKIVQWRRLTNPPPAGRGSGGPLV
jgi:hypothetical protein